MGLLGRLLGRGDNPRTVNAIVERAHQMVAVLAEEDRMAIRSEMDARMASLKRGGKIRSPVHLAVHLAACWQGTALSAWRRLKDRCSRDDCVRIAYALAIIDLFENYRHLSPNHPVRDMLGQAILEQQAIIPQMSYLISICDMHREEVAVKVVERLVEISALSDDEEIQRAQTQLMQATKPDH